jgi:hypothetical protein
MSAITCTPLDHLEIAGQHCPECDSDVDDYGNTEEMFHYCSFPDCGCDGARLCMAPNGASGASLTLNIEHGSLK